MNQEIGWSPFLKAILAGIMIGIGGVIYLSVENPVIGSLLFAIGLFTICAFQLNLFTGKVGYLVQKKPSYLLFLLLVWLGNYIGTGLVAWSIRATRLLTLNEGALLTRVQGMVATKLSDSFLSLFILAVFCGLLMFIAVDNYAHNPSGFAKVFGVVFGVMVFILASFEHSVADMFYFHLAQSYPPHAFLALGVITLGNTLGGILLPFLLSFSHNKPTL